MLTMNIRWLREIFSASLVVYSILFVSNVYYCLCQSWWWLPDQLFCQYLLKLHNVSIYRGQKKPLLILEPDLCSGNISRIKILVGLHWEPRDSQMQNTPHKNADIFQWWLCKGWKICCRYQQFVKAKALVKTRQKSFYRKWNNYILDREVVNILSQCQLKAVVF